VRGPAGRVAAQARPFGADGCTAARWIHAASRKGKSLGNESMNTTKAIEEYPLFVGGEWVKTAHETMLRLPYDGSVVARVYEADSTVMDRAIASAVRAAPAMAAMSNCDRSDLLWRLHSILKQQTEDFAHLISLETGKPIKEARVEADRSAYT